VPLIRQAPASPKPNKNTEGRAFCALNRGQPDAPERLTAALRVRPGSRRGVPSQPLGNRLHGVRASRQGLPKIKKIAEVGTGVRSVGTNAEPSSNQMRAIRRWREIASRARRRQAQGKTAIEDADLIELREVYHV